MKNLIILILISFTFSSCSIFKRTSKVKEIEKVETYEKANSDSTGTTIDKTKTVVKETIDTTINVPEKTSSSEVAINIDSLIEGMMAIKNDLFEVKLDYNPVTKILKTVATLKAHKLPIKFNKETTINNDITKKSIKKDAIIREEKKKVKKIDKKEEPAKMGIWLIAVIVGLVIIIASIYYWTKKKLPI